MASQSLLRGDPCGCWPGLCGPPPGAVLFAQQAPQTRGERPSGRGNLRSPRKGSKPNKRPVRGCRSHVRATVCLRRASPGPRVTCCDGAGTRLTEAGSPRALPEPLAPQCPQSSLTPQIPAPPSPSRPSLSSVTAHLSHRVCGGGVRAQRGWVSRGPGLRRGWTGRARGSLPFLPALSSEGPPRRWPCGPPSLGRVCTMGARPWRQRGRKRCQQDGAMGG